MEEYKIDGFRFDLSKGFTQKDSGSDVGKWSQYDASRIAILKHYTDVITNYIADGYAIMEHFAEFKEEKEMTDYGMMVWQNANYNFGQAVMGFNNSGIGQTFYLRSGFTYPNNVAYAESHDEERNMYRAKTFGNTNGDFNVKNIEIGLRRSEAAALFLFGLPGPKMIWQFGELGYDYSINDCGNGTVNNSCRLSNKPIRWDYYQDPMRRRLYDVYSSMIDLKKTQSYFQSDDVTVYGGGFVKQLYIKDNNNYLAAFANFDVTEQIVFSDFQTLGTYYEYFTGKTLQVNDLALEFKLKPGEYRLYTTKPLPAPKGGYKFFLSNEDLAPQLTQFEVYPNPTLQGEAIQVNVELNDLATVKLVLTDLSGRTIETISDAPYQTGNHSFQFGESLHSGVYLVTLQIGQHKTTKRIVKL
jgi:hypothetical protein